ncbi:hypothetical protein EW145_g3644 [Phellinidium pouzarii]|uniref:Uncharacterized protein n=1 Tax=Phellinidium pouzarii TaxID=167371 RepID=A0A4S4L6D7_9AGAM|nr:hypothetical protein EW145_g3644 [Phellinidium pouzarii]
MEVFTECSFPFVAIAGKKTAVITAKQLLRRWLQLNPTISIDNSDGSIAQLLRLISLVHTVGGISDANFDIVDSRDADLAFELDRDEFKWRWDTYLLGPKTSSEIISKHLIMPLVSLAHISFYSADPVSELDEEDLEKTVDKIGRTARRSVDIHVKHTFARPRIATTLQRVSSLFGFAPLLSPIKSEAEAPNFLEELSALHAHGDLPISSAPDSGKNSKRGDHIEQIERVQMPVEDKTSTKPPVAPHQEENAESVTESDEDDAFAQSKLEPKIVGARSRPASGSPEASVVPLHHRTSEISAPRPPSHPPYERWTLGSRFRLATAAQNAESVASESRQQRLEFGFRCGSEGALAKLAGCFYGRKGHDTWGQTTD